MRAFLEWLTSKMAPPRVIFDRDGQSPYLSRFYIAGAPVAPDGGDAFDATGAPREGIQWRDGWGVYLHKFHRGDDGEELHNHPWKWSVSLILAGGYIEERREGLDVVTYKYKPGAINILMADTFHRVDLREHDAWSLFIAGPKVQSWGFWDRATGIFKPWREHIDERRAMKRAVAEARAELDRMRAEIRTEVDEWLRGVAR